MKIANFKNRFVSILNKKNISQSELARLTNISATSFPTK